MTNREAALKSCKDRLEYLENAPSHHCGKRQRQRAIELEKVKIEALRPVTREQVILCKDCQYWQGNNGGYPHPECRWRNDETPDEDDYCSFAERLEVSKNG